MAGPLARWVFTLGATLAVGLVAACNSDDPAGPSATDVTPQFSFGGSGFSGSGQIGIGPHSGPPDYGGVAPLELFTAPPFHFVQIVFSGTITSTQTTYCNPPSGPEGTWGPSGLNDVGPQLGVFPSTSPDIGLMPGTELGQTTRTFNKGSGSGGDVTFYAERPGYSLWCDGGPRLSFTGGQAIDWEVYPYYDISASAAQVTLGDTVTFTATSHWAATGQGWSFRPDDTTATPGAGAGSPIGICSASSSTCDYAPQQSGRIYRAGYFPAPSGSLYTMPGPIVWVDSVAAPLVLRITSSAGGSVTRGDSVEFVVEDTTGGGLGSVQLRWKFEPDSVQFYPSSTGLKFAPDPVWDTINADSVWSGEIVHPGRIIVWGQSGADTSSDTIVVSITPRAWSAPHVVLDSVNYYNSAMLPLPSGTSLVGGKFHPTPDDFFPDSTFFDQAPGTDSVLTGPNAGYHYVSASNLNMNRAYSLNPWIDPPGSFPYYRGHSTTDWLINQGDSVAMMQRRANTIMHERGPTAIVQGSHLERHNLGAADFLACGNVNMANERLVFSDPSALDGALTSAFVQAKTAILYASGHYYVYNFQSQGTAATADWNQKGNILYGLLDAQDPNNDNYPAPFSQLCDISNF